MMFFNNPALSKLSTSRRITVPLRAVPGATIEAYESDEADAKRWREDMAINDAMTEADHCDDCNDEQADDCDNCDDCDNNE